ncbi:MAG TPA: protein sip-5 [Luteimonas sp.]|nr:protein sip-5 [Luteimonas sp.]
MNFEQLKRRVERAEYLMDERTRRTHAAWDTVRLEWRAAWTPGRIVGVGLVAGFIAGRSQPGPAVKRLRAAAGPQLLQWITTFSGLSASLQAAMAAMTAKGAARTADAAADTAEQAADTVEDAAVTATGAPPSARRTAAPAAAATARVAVAPPATPAATDPATPRPVPTVAAHDHPSPSERRYRPDPAYQTEPRPAEAATDVSEARWAPPRRGEGH